MYVWILMLRNQLIVILIKKNSSKNKDKYLRWYRTFGKNTKHLNTYIHTYIIGDYNHSVRIIDLVSNTTYVVYVNFIHKWRELQFHGNFYLFSEFLPEIGWEEGNRRRNTFFVFCFDVWPGARTLALRLISQHTTY